MTRVPEPSLTFIVPVRDDAVRLSACLASIRASAGGEAIELVVVDNDSVDHSAGVAGRAGARVLSVSGGKVSSLRNQAARLASGALLAFVDSDHVIGPAWVSAARQAFSNPLVAGAGALCRAPADGTWVQRGYDTLRGRTKERKPVTWLGSGNLVVRREAFEAVGGFDETLDTCEDVDLCHRLRAGGGLLLNEPDMDSLHFGDPATLAELFRAERWRGRDNLRVSLRHRPAARDLPSIAVPVLQAAALVGLPVMAAAAPVLRPARWGALLAGGIIVGPAVARTLLRVGTEGGPSAFRGIAGAFAVAATYDAARALALLTRAGHHRDRPRQAGATE